MFTQLHISGFCVKVYTMNYIRHIHRTTRIVLLLTGFALISVLTALSVKAESADPTYQPQTGPIFSFPTTLDPTKPKPHRELRKQSLP